MSVIFSLLFFATSVFGAVSLCALGTNAVRKCVLHVFFFLLFFSCLTVQKNARDVQMEEFVIIGIFITCRIFYLVIKKEDLL